MRRTTLVQVVLFVFYGFTVVIQGSDYVSVCYYTRWSATAEHINARLTVAEIDPNLCTHLVYAFGNVDISSKKLVPVSAGVEDSFNGKEGLYAQFNNLKKKNPNLVTLLSIGGEGQENTEAFAQLASKDEWITKFAKSASSFLRKRGFDGLDVDWEYPNATTKASYTQLLKGIREEFEQEATRHQDGRRRLLLTIAVSPGEHKVDKGYQVASITKYVDYIFLMAYDFFGSWSIVAGFNAPLNERNDPAFSKLNSVKYAVNLWLEKGADRRKLVVGMTGAGAVFTLNDSANHDVGDVVKHGGGNPGSLYAKNGRLIYPEICLALDLDWTRVWDEEQEVPYAYHGDQWVGYDDQKSIRIKTKYVMENKLAGAMFWELSFDDPKGKFCNQGKYPLLTVIQKTLGLESGTPSVTKHIEPKVKLVTKDESGATTTRATSALQVAVAVLLSFLIRHSYL